MKAKLLLYCEGRTDDGFIFCNGVENYIVSLEEFAARDNYLEIIEYLDKVVGIFDAPCCNMNIIGSAIYKLYEWNCIEQGLYKRVIDFCQFHNRCGLVLYALPNE